MNTVKRRLAMLAVLVVVTAVGAAISKAAEEFTIEQYDSINSGKRYRIEPNTNAVNKFSYLVPSDAYRPVAGDTIAMQWQFPQTEKFMKLGCFDPSRLSGWNTAGDKQRFLVEPCFPDSQKVLPECKPAPALRIDSSIPAPAGDSIAMQWQFPETTAFMRDEQVFVFGGLALLR
ncbi:hypothetical protein [Adhaeretor mobilis]|uniref:Uncharacterized protein n=1 Tax=Adhaeretor mobilis TaxID=1930276 RepID=A0A517N387_9BACT|nr:hypothetical protein [Adhaeretor mobilis]QDT01607.1 hypothetical protein HG15A2_49540 [Adhaeretor mobilis]